MNDLKIGIGSTVGTTAAIVIINCFILLIKTKTFVYILHIFGDFIHRLIHLSHFVQLCHTCHICRLECRVDRTGKINFCDNKTDITLRCTSCSTSLQLLVLRLTWLRVYAGSRGFRCDFL